MKAKYGGVTFLVLFLVFGSFAGEVYAFDQGEKEKSHFSLEDKFSKKTKLILSNQDELGLSDEQVKKVKELKLETKKGLLKANAEIDIIALDIKAKMWTDSIDTNSVNKLIDKKYDLKKEKTKSLVAAYVALKDILTKEQKEKMGELYKKCKMKSSMKKSKRKCSKCSMVGGGR